MLTLGALVAAEMFGKQLPVVRLQPEVFARLSQAKAIRIEAAAVVADGEAISLLPPATSTLSLTEADRSMLEGGEGVAVAQAMRILTAMAAQQVRPL